MTDKFLEAMRRAGATVIEVKPFDPSEAKRLNLTEAERRKRGTITAQ